ncbi:MAG TPA: sugar phosphate nucleotidyltransferase [bacterium]|nr:sugar phosphate nucleotidyltransferase [bacterium]HQG45177.1 sugar phosphate nucleotidyltransferase [bacterium]HQI48900.1 sugar phosphate nucleotidyltransferase [bacterium]HQJ64804.1 sugar phosphate nucleotidyltransferase [bacterium]
MNAMILAAGFGTRLHPLTQNRPKALVPLADHPLLEISLRRLMAAGFDRIAVNAHHFAEQVREWLAGHPYPGAQIYLEEESEILGTGGGIAGMIPLLGSDQPILVHNVDVLSTLPLRSFYDAHRRLEPEATLAIQQRKTERYLVFDDQARLCGRASAERHNQELICTPRGQLHYFAFNGIQVIEPRLFLNAPTHAFSSIDHYLEAAAAGARIIGLRMDEWYWRDLGRPADLEAAAEDITGGLVSVD